MQGIFMLLFLLDKISKEYFKKNVFVFCCRVMYAMRLRDVDLSFILLSKVDASRMLRLLPLIIIVDGME